MAYGKGEKDKQRRSIHSGTTALQFTDLPIGKLKDLVEIRNEYLAVANAFVDAVFITEPLLKTRTSADILDILTDYQKYKVKGFNKAFVEKARLAIPSAIDQVQTKYLHRLFGRLLNCSKKTNESDPAKRQYFSIPVSIQNKVTQKQLEALVLKVSELGYQKIIALFRQVVIDKSCRGLTRKEYMVIRSIHEECLGKYAKPAFGSDPRFQCQINLDYRVIRGKTTPVQDLDKEARLLVDKKNRKFRYFLEKSNPVPRGDSIKIPMVMSARTLKRFDDNSSVSSISLVIGPESVTVRTIISKPDQEPPLDKISYLIARDFGMINTISLSVIKLDDPIDPEEYARIIKFTREEAREYLTSYSHPNQIIIERVRYSGRKFLDNIEKTCARIDKLKSQIDGCYNTLEILKAYISFYMDLNGKEHLPVEHECKDLYIKNIYDKFFRLFNHIISMKKKRFSLYTKIAGVKKSWFGFLANQEIKLLKKYNAALVREDLTILTIETDSPEYRGRSFNKMINNGSKGKYVRCSSDKLRWDGIPELVVPSYYTSTTCTIHSRVDETMRHGEVFCCPLCGKKEHADEHAADTLAYYLQLKRNTKLHVTLHLPRSRSSARNHSVGSPNQ